MIYIYKIYTFGGIKFYTIKGKDEWFKKELLFLLTSNEVIYE